MTISTVRQEPFQEYIPVMGAVEPIDNYHLDAVEGGVVEEIYIEVITALASAIDARDAYTHGHSNRVTEYTVAIADQMGLSPAEVDIIRNASILHDVGKIGIKEDILKKPGRLSEEERREMEFHPFIGTRILQEVKLLEPVLPLVYHHHERYDGTGYPDRLKGDEIPIGARLIAVADAFDTMTTRRSYQPRLSPDAALSELNKHAGTQFCPLAVKAFISKFLENQEMPESNS